MIAIDAMGGDFAPKSIVRGAFKAAQRGIPILLYGDALQIEPILLDCAHTARLSSWHLLPITLTHTTQIISMDHEPSRAVIAQKDSSLVRAIQSVADGTASAFVSAGNSGAVMVASTLILGRVEGVLRPAIGEWIPTKNGSIFCMDLGANTDCKPEFLEQFAYMGHAYTQVFKHIEKPRIALLSNGAENNKGSSVVKQTFTKLQHSTLHFIGNIESRDMFDDHADVLICDGFVGNVLLKGLEGTTRAITHWIHEERKKSWLYTLGLFLSKGLFKNLKKKIDYTQFGGALLLGVTKPVIIAHGCSTENAIEQSIVFAQKITQEKLIETFNAQLKKQLKNISAHHTFNTSANLHKQLSS